MLTAAKPTELTPFLELGVSPQQAEKAVKYLRSDGAANGKLETRSRRLALLANACGSLQNAKLAYSLAARSGIEPDDLGVRLLSAALACCDCVPAAVRLWKAASLAGIKDEGLLVTAARLGGDGAETVRLLELLATQPERAELAAELARQLVAPGWSAEGSWGGRPDEERRLVWWDFTRPKERAPYGMSLTSAPLSLAGKVGSCLVFEARWEILGVTDRCHLEISRDGGKKWDKLARYEGVAEWAEQRIPLQEYDGGQIVIRFHVLSGGQRQGRGFEMAQARIECVPVTHRVKLSFPELTAGWQKRSAEDRGESLSGHESESALRSSAVVLPELESPTLTLEGRMVASSVYAKATVAVEHNGSEPLTLEVPTSSEWKALRLPLGGLRELTVELNSRFNQRKDEDGLWVRKVMIQGGAPGVLERIELNGGAEDGEKERLALLAVLTDEEGEKLAHLAKLRDGLSSLRDALALLPLVSDSKHIPVLLDLYSRLKEEALSAFRLLLETASDDDLELQARVLLASGLTRYPSTRDHLGDGLVSGEEFADNCALYLQMRERWEEETARSGLGLLMTPIGDESLAERGRVFRHLLSEHEAPDGFFAAWERSWEA